MSDWQPPPERDEEAARVSQPPDDGRGGGRGWMLATVALIALALGVVAGLVIDGGDEKTQTVHRTIVETAPSTSTSLGVTVTTPVRTVERTVTAEPSTVTVTVPAGDDVDGNTTDTTAP